MKCVKCKSREGTIIIPSLQKKACNQCFARIIEKRFGKTLRQMGLKQAKLKLKRPSDELLKLMLEQRGVKTNAGEPINQSTLDDVCVNTLKSFFKGKDYLVKGQSPFESISEKELIIYARVKKLSFKGNPRQGFDKELHDLLLKLDQRRPGVMYSIKDFMKKLF